MADNRISLGQYVVNRYQELKSIVKEKGTPEETETGTRYYTNDSISLNEDSHIHWGAAVDDNSQTRDEITTTTFYMPSTPVTRPNEKIETFTEKMQGDRQVITFHYLEYMSMSGIQGKAEFTETFDAKTGEMLKPDKK